MTKGEKMIPNKNRLKEFMPMGTALQEDTRRSSSDLMKNKSIQKAIGKNKPHQSNTMQERERKTNTIISIKHQELIHNFNNDDDN